MKEETQRFICIALLFPLAYLYHDRFYNERSYALERQDLNEVDGKYNKEQFLDMMHILAETNERAPDGWAATLNVFDKLYEAPSSILEIGYGLGRFSVKLAERYPHANVTGVDSHAESYNSAVGYLSQLDDAPVNVYFKHTADPRLNEKPKSYDIITSTFVNHHIFPDESFVEFLRSIARVGRKAYIFNDYYRSTYCVARNTLAMSALRFMSEETILRIARYESNPVLEVFRDRPGKELVIDGGILSMKRSFSMIEYQKLFHEAGFPREALKCTDLHKWYDLSSQCRVVCTADLTWDI